MSKKQSPITLIKRVTSTLKETSKNDTKDTNFEEKARKNLTKRQLFIEYYIQSLNATQAAIKAGYSPKTARLTGHRLITNDSIKSKIDDLLKQRLENCNVDTEFILQGLKDIATNLHYPCKDRVKAYSLLGDYNKPTPTKIEVRLTD